MHISTMSIAVLLSVVLAFVFFLLALVFHVDSLGSTPYHSLAFSIGLDKCSLLMQ